MGKKSLENFCKKLFVNLTEGFVFYIPDNSVINDLIIESNAEEFRSFLQKVIIMDWHKGPLMYINSLLQFNELDKSSLLNKNVLKLIEKKEKLEPISFEYIFNKYYDQVRAMNLVVAWLNDYSRLEELDDKRTKTIQTFKLQQLLFDKHQSELEKVFCSSNTSRSDYSASDKLELQLPILLDQLHKIESNQLTNNKIVYQLIAITQKKSKQTELSKKPKKLLISEAEAEEFLLASTFGIKLQH